MSEPWSMAERRSWVDVKMELGEAVSGSLGRTGWKRGIRGGVIGLVFVRRRRRISSVLATRKWGGGKNKWVKQSVSIRHSCIIRALCIANELPDLLISPTFSKGISPFCPDVYWIAGDWALRIR
jgi:hypothetical protein